MAEHLQVWISRPPHRAGALAEALRQRGLMPVLCPALRIAEMPDKTALQNYQRDIKKFEVSIFISAEAASRVAVGAGEGATANLPALAIGDSTAAALPPIYRLLTPPQAAADSRALLRLPLLQSPAAVAVLGGTDENGKPPAPLLCRVLAMRGAAVFPVPCYLRQPAPPEPDLSELGRNGAIAAAVAYSTETLRFMLEMNAPDNDWLRTRPLFVIHQNIARTAHRLGFRRVIVAAAADMAAQIAAALSPAAPPNNPVDVG